MWCTVVSVWKKLPWSLILTGDAVCLGRSKGDSKGASDGLTDTPLLVCVDFPLPGHLPTKLHTQSGKRTLPRAWGLDHCQEGPRDGEALANSPGEPGSGPDLSQDAATHHPGGRPLGVGSAPAKSPSGPGQGTLVQEAPGPPCVHFSSPLANALDAQAHQDLQGWPRDL